MRGLFRTVGSVNQITARARIPDYVPSMSRVLRAFSVPPVDEIVSNFL
jgi:hypothetical protein